MPQTFQPISTEFDNKGTLVVSCKSQKHIVYSSFISLNYGNLNLKKQHKNSLFVNPSYKIAST